MTILSIQRNLRKNMPKPEALLWKKIRGNQLGIKFRRQYAVPYNPNPENPIPTFPFKRGRRPVLNSSPFLRERLGEGLRFRILDFYSAEAQLGIEIDGESHFVDVVKRFYELKSDRIISNQQGIKILRFLNTDIIENLDGVLEKISSYIGKN